MLKFPYGNANFYNIITENYFYIDRTDRIRNIEARSRALLFLRPRRFGKSLLLSMLENYYDVRRAAEFESLFGQLAIGQKPTPKHNQYFVLKWDFSGISTQGDLEFIKQQVNNHINGCIEQFKVRYQDWLTYDIALDPTNGLRSFVSVLAAMQTTPHLLYLFIDEYDNFANEILMGGQAQGQKRYEDLVQGEGFLKTLFKVIKAELAGQGLDRVFITGVSPVVMSDITSGFNIAENIYLEPEFNDMCGFREDEIATILQQIEQSCGFTADQTRKALETMRTFYNGYSFTYDQPPLIYNPTLALYFLKHLQASCQYPREMLDSNLAMDRHKITYISRLPQGEQVISAALDEAYPLTSAKLADRFGVEDMLYGAKNRQFMVSLLYFFGVLTLTENYTDWGELVFKIPNLVIKGLYVERIHDMLLPTGLDQDQAYNTARHFYGSGDMAALCEFIEQKYYTIFDNRDYRWTNELTIKTVFMTVLFNDTFYIMDSETPLKRDYSDFIMLVRSNMRRFKLLDFLIEFKYIPLKEIGLSGEQVRAMNYDELAEQPLVKAKLAEAQAKTPAYRQTLETTYSEKLRLHCYAVVSVGYDRLVWWEL